ncbi:hypothetical protein BH20ACT2_BH20ACT2_25670 [soil metagenome]
MVSLKTGETRADGAHHPPHAPARPPATVEVVPLSSSDPPRERRRVLRPACRMTVAAVVGVVAFLVIGNVAILGASAWAKISHPAPAAGGVEIPGVDNLNPVDDKVWRGSAPSRRGYATLADEGFTTVIDLRAEDDVDVDGEALADLGLTLVKIPLRDGQAPGDGAVERFLAAAEASPGKVFVHCGAGVGRAGTMAAAWLVGNGEADGSGALMRNLAVGPPSLEQVLFVQALNGGSTERPGPVLTGVSRLLDGPRRLWSRYGL